MSAIPPRRPRAGSLRAKLIRFFEVNPDEELDYTAVAAKFSVSRAVAKGIVLEMSRRGELETAHIIRLPARRAS